ncbi:unnamed protein product, partial [Pelagomonas calceolata]
HANPILLLLQRQQLRKVHEHLVLEERLVGGGRRPQDLRVVHEVAALHAAPRREVAERRPQPRLRRRRVREELRLVALEADDDGHDAHAPHALAGLLQLRAGRRPLLLELRRLRVHEVLVRGLVVVALDAARVEALSDGRGVEPRVCPPREGGRHVRDEFRQSGAAPVALEARGAVGDDARRRHVFVRERDLQLADRRAGPVVEGVLEFEAAEGASRPEALPRRCGGCRCECGGAGGQGCHTYRAHGVVYRASTQVMTLLPGPADFQMALAGSAWSRLWLSGAGGFFF